MDESIWVTSICLLQHWKHSRFSMMTPLSAPVWAKRQSRGMSPRPQPVSEWHLTFASMFHKLLPWSCNKIQGHLKLSSVSSLCGISLGLLLISSSSWDIFWLDITHYDLIIGYNSFNHHICSKFRSHRILGTAFSCDRKNSGDDPFPEVTVMAGRGIQMKSGPGHWQSLSLLVKAPLHTMKNGQTRNLDDYQVGMICGFNKMEFWR